MTMAARGAWPQSAYPGTSYRDYSRCLPDYLRDLAQHAYRRRNEAIAKLTTPDAIAKRQQWVRDNFWQMVGGKPERTPLRARTVASFDRPGYRLENVVYESRPELYITANLYVPAAGKPPYPGVLFQMGHSLNGKAAETYQKCCQGLARLGYVVLAFDPMGQGERVYYPGLSADKDHELHRKQATGDGAVISFTTGDSSFSQWIVSNTRLFSIAVSFGSVNSVISLPYAMSHASIPDSLRENLAPPPDLVRLSIGIEDAGDLLADLDQAFAAARDRPRPNTLPVCPSVPAYP